MTILKKLTFADYLALEDSETETRTELVDGELIELAPESGLNTNLATFVFVQLLAIGVPLTHLKLYCCEVQTPVLAPKDAANRYPDLVLLQDEHQALTYHRNTITLEMPPPRFVMEVVSPKKSNRERDYVRKREQYAAVGIVEYWIVDPQEQVIIVLVLNGSSYQEQGRYQGNQQIISLTFTSLDLTAAQVFAAGNLQ